MDNAEEIKPERKLAEDIFYHRTQMNALDPTEVELLDYFEYRIKSYAAEQNQSLRELLERCKDALEVTIDFNKPLKGGPYQILVTDIEKALKQKP